MSSSRRRLRFPLSVQLAFVLLLVAVALAAGVAQVTGHREQQARIVDHSARREAAAQVVARRAAPLLEQGDGLRLGVLAAAAADLDDARVLMLDREGRVLADSAGRAVGERRDLIAGARGVLREVGVEGIETVAAAALGSDGYAGEVRLLHARAAELAEAWSWQLFGLVLLGQLSLVAVACWVAHAWQMRIASATDRIQRLAAGELAADLETIEDGLAEETEAASAALGGAVRDLMVRDAERRRRTRAGALRLAREVVHALERRELIAVGHAERVQRLASALALECGADERTRSTVRDAAPLLDLGKFGVRASALQVPHDLDATERESLRQHPLRGARLLESVDGLIDVAVAVRHQHEKYDGTGYPQGLRASRIPLASRLLAIASAFDSLVEGGPGFEPLSWPDALDQLRDDRGEHFDPQLLDAFEVMVRRSPPSRSRRTAVTISTAGVLPHRVIDEPLVGSVWGDGEDLGDEAERILAHGYAELELMIDELGEDEEEEEA